MFDPFFIGFLLGGLLTGVTLGAIFGNIEAKHIRDEIAKTREECKTIFIQMLEDYDKKGGDDF